MRVRRSLLSSTSGVPIPVSVNIKGESFLLRDYVIRMALEKEDRPLTPVEEKEILEITRVLKKEITECWTNIDPSQYCKGILRAVRMLVNLLEKRPREKHKQEISDLKRWLDYGRRL